MPDAPKLPILEVGAAAINVATHSPAGTAGSLLVKAFQSIVARKAEEDDDRAFNVYVTEWATIRGLPRDEAKREVQRMLLSGKTQHDDKLYAMFKSMVFSRSAAAWPYIARMTAEYVVANKARDDFFRRVGWLLERCEDEDIDILKAGSNETERKTHGQEWAVVLWSWGDEPEIRVDVRPEHTTVVSNAPMHTRPVPRSAEVLALLTDARLVKGHGSRMVSFSEKSTLDRLIVLFRE